MYASQWFLTVFTAKFPLYLVFRVLDVFLFDGFDAIFQVKPIFFLQIDLKNQNNKKQNKKTREVTIRRKSPTLLFYQIEP